MSLNTQPLFTRLPVVGSAEISVANTALDGTGAIVDVVDVPTGDNPIRIEVIEVRAIVTTTDGMIRLFIDDGVNVLLWMEIPITGTVPAATVQAANATLLLADPLVLPAGHTLQASTHNAESFNVFARGGQF